METIGDRYFESDKTEQAWRMAREAHQGQVRSADDAPYETHVMAVATAVACWQWDDIAIQAALLHDTLEDSDKFSFHDIQQQQGEDVARLVQALSKNKDLPKQDRSPEVQMRLHTLLPVLGPRLAIIKLADRVHNMMTAKHLSAIKRQTLASDAKYFFSPLSMRLGMERMANWLLTCSFHENYSDSDYLSIIKNFSSEANPTQVYIYCKTN